MEEAWTSSAEVDQSVSVPTFTDVAGRGVATQSSLSRWSLAEGAQAAVGGRRDRDFTIHTAPDDDSPWWGLDLKAWYPASQIVIRNRRNPAYWSRTASIRVEVSEDDASWTLVHAGHVFFGADDDALVLPLAGRLPVRFLRISLDRGSELHLLSVEVMVDSRTVAHRRLMESVGLAFSARTRYSHGAIKQETYSVSPADPEPGAPVTGLRVVRSGRFANNVFQMVQSLQIADRRHLKFVQMFDIPLFSFPNVLAEDGTSIVSSSASLPESAVIVEGDFFYISRLGRALGRTTSYAPDAVRYAKKYLRPHLNLPEVPPAPSDELHIHVRSGDLFGERPHPKYGQPPLAFYVRAVSLARDSGFRSVRIVAEDRLNPVVDALREHLEATGIPVSMQVGEDLATDIATLLSARGLVFGVGTFGHAVCMLSSKVETVFEGTGSSTYTSLFPHLTVHSIRPRVAEYSPFVNWVGSRSQFTEMIDYPIDRLEYDVRLGQP